MTRRQPFSIKGELNRNIVRSEHYWSISSQESALLLFHRVAENVPAYKEHLKKNKLNPSVIKKWSDWKHIPPTNKKNYITTNSLQDLCWHGELNREIIFSSTSGSTGQAYYFPRSREIDLQNAVIQASFLKRITISKKLPILVIVTFGMGPWIGGLISYEAYRQGAEAIGYPISIITPGIDREKIIHILKMLAPFYQTTILCGYPPFIKDIIDEADKNRVDLKQLNIKVSFAAEGFTEKYRNYISSKLGMKDVLIETMNIYGSAEIGAMAAETPLSIMLRKIAGKNANLAKDLFGRSDKLPTFAQYNPLYVNFNEYNGELFITGNNVVPLINYAIGDEGGIIYLSQIKKILTDHNIIFEKELKEFFVKDFSKQPFVFVFERKDFSVSFYGLQVYPEHIRDVFLEHRFQNKISGRFVMETTFDKNQNQILNIHIESSNDKKNFSTRLTKELLRSIVNSMKQKNSEYGELYGYLKQKALPQLIFYAQGNEKYFQKNIKQKWVH